MTERDIFLQAQDILDEDERRAFLEKACAGNSELRRKVDELLLALQRAGTFLEEPHPAAAPPEPTRPFVPPVREISGTLIAGRYKLLERIGQGGMGEVWVAEQTQPVKRKVALKLIKPGLDSRQVLARFEAERQALALMDHPNVAKVHDGGLTEAGRPFFVMEYVKGMPLTQYCDDARLDVPARLALFAQVCQAVQHAHTKGIIHRDLKPSNILVAPYDDKPVPKVIDFGLAKAVHQPLTEHTLHTAHEMVLGTPLYMSPEQAQLNNLDVDTRSDVYSLGVLLYELLTGTTPLEKQRFKQAAWDEVRRIIREEEPPRPSTRLSTAGALPSLAASRHTEPAKLALQVRGDLDWIVMKALEKDRTRRYETANGFAADVQRYLAGEAVLAHPPSAPYRLKKFVRRYKGQVAAAGLVLLSLLAGMAGTSWGMWQANRAADAARDAGAHAVEQQRLAEEAAERERKAKQEAEARKADAERAAAAEKAAHEQSQKRLAQLEKGNEVITSIFADLDIRAVRAGTEPLEAVLAKRLVGAARQLEGEAVGDPLAVASLQNRLGRSLLSLGYPQDAIPLFSKACETRTAWLGADHLDTLATLGNLASGYRRSGKLDLALPLFEEALSLTKAKYPPDHPHTLQCMNNLAGGYVAAGKFDLAVPLYEETVRHLKAKHPPDHIYTLRCMSNLASAYQHASRLDLALPLYEETLRLQRDKLRADHPDTLETMNNLAAAYKRTGKLDLALPLLEEALRHTKDKLGADHLDTLMCMNNLAVVYRAVGKLDLALPLFEQAAVGIERRRFPRFPSGSTYTITNTIEAYEAARQFDRAEAWRRKWLVVVKERSGADSLPYANELVSLGVSLFEQKRWTDAEPVLRECLAIREKHQPDDWRTFNTRSMLGGALLGQKKYAEAEPLLLQGYTGLKQREKAIPQQGAARLLEALNRVIGLYVETDRPEQAKKWQAEKDKLLAVQVNAKEATGQIQNKP